jgi:hypothetical protein
VYLQTKAGKAAASTVAEEIRDNLSLMLQRFAAKTGEDPVLVMDNARIQSSIPADCIESKHGDIQLQPHQRVKLPAHSPDLNQVAEQSVGAVKSDVIGQIADHVQAGKGSISAEELTRMGKLASEHFAAGQVFDGGVRKSVYRMPDVWAVVGADEDSEVHVAGHGTLHGTAGDSAPAALR